MPSQQLSGGEAGGPILSIWDSEYYAPSEAFSVFREAICGTFMPWSPEFDSERAFEGRIKGLVFDDKSVGHVSISPLVAVRANTHLANSAIDGFYANFVLSGELHVEQAGHSSHARRGDLIVYDTARPVKMTSRSNARYEDISFLIPKNCFSHVKDAEDRFANIVLEREKIIEPLHSSLRFLADNMQSMSEMELVSLYNSCISLIPVAAGCYGDRQVAKPNGLQANGLWREIADYLNRNLADTDMSPAHAAGHFGISVRYIHKLFAERGATFSTYVNARRLDNIRDDLMSPGSRGRPISDLAFRWGFRDLSSFNRAFKNRFDLSPKQFRERHRN